MIEEEGDYGNGFGFFDLSIWLVCILDSLYKFFYTLRSMDWTTFTRGQVTIQTKHPAIPLPLKIIFLTLYN